MRSIKAVGAAIIAVLALGPVAAGASGHEFTSTKQAELSAEATSKQVFITEGGTTSCATLTAEGETIAGNPAIQEATVYYSKCSAFGFIAVTITPAYYQFNANEWVTLLKAMTIETIGCVVTVPAQKALAVVKYANEPGGKLGVTAEVVGIESSGEGEYCTYAKENAGTYKGTSLISAPGSILSWV